MQNKKLTFLLIHPEISRTKYNFVGVIENECLELEYISALLKDRGHDVFLYDGQVEKITVPKAIKKYKPDVVYVCGRTRQENFMLEYCKDAKEYNPKIITIIGGLHAQLCYERMYRDYVDYILTSYDINHVAELAESDITLKADVIDNKDDDRECINDSRIIELCKNMEGLCYKENGKWHHNIAKPCDINDLPRPDRTYFYEHPDNYRYLELEHAAWVRTAYSCPYRCKFCHRNRMNQSTYSARDIIDVVDEIEALNEANIYIVDDDFLYDEKRLWTFVEEIKKRNISKKYICYGRADFISTHESLMAALKEIGLYYVLVGLEAVNDKQLKDYNKLSDMRSNIKSVQICNSLGIHLMGMFILDLDFKRRDFKDMYRFAKENNIAHVALSIYTPEMGLENFEDYKDRMITDNPSHFDYLHLVAKPENLSVRAYYFEYYILLIRFFLKAKKEGIYDFIDYGDYIKSFLKNMFMKRSHDDE